MLYYSVVPVEHYQINRYIFQATQYSTRRPGFFSQFIDNVKQDIAKNKEMKDSLKKFRAEADKLEHSDALQAARKKFQTVESEASKGGEVLKERLEGIKGKMQEVMDEAGKSDIAKKAGEKMLLVSLFFFIILLISYCKFTR